MNLLERRRALLIAQTKKDDIVLPSDYIKLNYIESTGTQWINTNYLCKDDYTPYRVKCKFKMTEIIGTGYKFVFGTNQHNTGVEYVLSFAVDMNNGKFSMARFGTTGSGLRCGNLDTEVHEIEYILNEGSYFDNVFIEGSEQQASLIDVFSNRNMGLFARINGTAIKETQMSKCQIYKFEMYGKDEKNMILVPAQRKVDGEIGMYDIVTNTFLTNSGSGEFIGG